MTRGKRRSGNFCVENCNLGEVFWRVCNQRADTGCTACIHFLGGASCDNKFHIWDNEKVNVMENFYKEFATGLGLPFLLCFQLICLVHLS